jgi:ABC-type transport system involved in cytochrome bd biosynthesis fused ATPase/permease subunit
LGYITVKGGGSVQQEVVLAITHDERIATTADRLISMRDGAFVDETRLTGGSRGNLGTFAEWGHPR